MKNVIEYNNWKVSCEDTDDRDEITSVVETLNFKGYMNSVVGEDENGNVLEVKTRAVDRLSELSKYDFSECYLYKIQRVDYNHFILPEGKSPTDYTFEELNNFDRELRYGYRVRYAGKEKEFAPQ